MERTQLEFKYSTAVQRVKYLEDLIDQMKESHKMIEDELRQEIRGRPRKATIMTQETVNDESPRQMAKLQTANQQLLETLTLVNEKNRSLEDRLNQYPPNCIEEIELLRDTISEFERQRSLADKRMQESVRDHETQIQKLEEIIAIQQGEMTQLRKAALHRQTGPLNLSTLSPIHPPFATHENVTPQYIIPPDPNHWSPHQLISNKSPPFLESACNSCPPSTAISTAPLSSVASSAPMTSRLESDLLRLNLERQEIETWLGRVPNSGRTIMEKKEKRERVNRLNHVEKTIGEIKAKLRQRKLEKQRPLG